MKEEELKPLLEAYGYQKTFDDPEHCRTRWQSEGGFIDVWFGRKRVTIGIHDEKTRLMQYKRVYNLEQAEAWITA